MATVYKAYEEPLTRHVAIKVLPEFFAEDRDYRVRFQVEAVAVAKLRHNNILTVFAYGEEEGVPYIVCEFVDGGTLAERLDGAMPMEDTIQVLTPVASALDYAHSQGVLHRDVKPSNIMLLSDGTPVLTDFGLAKVLGGDNWPGAGYPGIHGAGARLRRRSRAGGRPVFARGSRLPDAHGSGPVPGQHAWRNLDGPDSRSPSSRPRSQSWAER